MSKDNELTIKPLKVTPATLEEVVLNAAREIVQDQKDAASQDCVIDASDMRKTILKHLTHYRTDQTTQERARIPAHKTLNYIHSKTGCIKGWTHGECAECEKSAGPQSELHVWECVMCQISVGTICDFHINSRPICCQCNAEMIPFVGEPLTDEDLGRIKTKVLAAKATDPNRTTQRVIEEYEIDGTRYRIFGFDAEAGSDRGQEDATPREPHDGWMNAWFYANVPRNQNCAYLWNPEVRKFAGDWAEFKFSLAAKAAREGKAKVISDSLSTNP